MLDVVVTCVRHGPEIATFPQVRGYYLAKHLARSGVDAEFRQLPLPSLQCRVVICSEYQCPIDYFQRKLEPSLSEIDADRMYCMADKALVGQHRHFSQGYRDWFIATGGGVLCHLPDVKLERHEKWIGVGVDLDVVPAPLGPSDRILFDFPQSSTEDAAPMFDIRVLDTVRARLNGCVIAGSGPADAPVRGAFDEWVAYGQEHTTYVRAAFHNLFAFVPGLDESMGLSLAEAQAAGASIVFSGSQVRESMLCPEATVHYRAGDPDSLAHALIEARTRDRERIRAQAADHFDFAAVAARTRAAIGLSRSGLAAQLGRVTQKGRR